MPNTLRYDPTRTTTLRNRYSAEMRRRFNAVRSLVIKAVGDLDVLGLGPAVHIFNVGGGLTNQRMVHQGGATPTLPTINVLPEVGAFRFSTDEQKVQQFNQWFQEQVDNEILSVRGTGEPWTAKYVDSAYRKGSVRAYTDAHKEALAESPDFYKGSKEQFLRSSFAQPERISKLKLLYTRSYEDLKGITAVMGQQVSRVLADGIASGRGPRALASDLASSIDGITKKRALTMARTEIIHAHAEGQLDSFQDLDVDELDVMAEWDTAGDARVCPMCRPLEGTVMTVKEARGLIPRHPNCRCAWIPANVGESTKGQIWSKTGKQEKVKASLKAEHPKLPTKEARAVSTWMGKRKKFGGRPKPGSVAFKKAVEEKKAALLEKQAQEAAAKQATKIQADAAAGILNWGPDATAEVLDHANYYSVGWGPVPAGKTQSYGMLIFDNQGRVLMREPAGHFGGAHWTFAKGGGTKPGTTALKELAEEMGHKGIVHDVLPGDFVGTETKTNYFIGKSGGFDGSLMDTETATVKWMTYADAKDAIALSKNAAVVARDTEVLEAAYKHLAKSDGSTFAKLISSGTANLKTAQEAAAKAAQAHKIKAGLAKSHWKKPQFGGGVLPEDYVNPATQQKLSISGVNKVLSEKGWHSTTLPKNVVDDILRADDVVAQKSIMAGLKKAPKATPKVPLPGAAVPVDPLPIPKTIKLPLESDLTKVKDLPGSTKPYLAKDSAGKHWVVKDTSGTSIKPAHLRSEATADTLYNRLGIPVPEGGVVNAPGGPMKITEFLEGGQTLAEWKVGKTAEQIADMHKQIRKGFVSDALFANHDVAGLSNDNIFIVGGKAYRIDNGGALSFRAQGGVKRTWGPKVQELKTMRDASVNANTAAIYDGITDAEIHDQIRHVVKNRDALLAAVDDDAVRKTLAARIDDLASQLPSVPVSRPIPEGARRVAYGNGPEVAEKVKKARSNGLTLAGDAEDIEDNNILIWEEKGARNKARTRMQFKVTREGSDKIRTTLGADLEDAQRAAGLSTNVHPEDKYWDTVLKGTKSVNHHVGDKKYNEATLAELAKINTEITSKLATATGDTKEMLQHYAESIKKIGEAKLAGTTTGQMSQYVYKPDPKRVVRERRRAFNMKKENKVAFDVMDFDSGIGKMNAQKKNNITTGEAYVIDAGDGIEVRFIPSVPDVNSQAGLALKGTVNVTVPEGVTEASINKALEIVKQLGINPTPPSAAYEEALYIHRNVYLLGKADDVAYERIWTSKALTDEERVVQMKKWVKDSMGVDVSKVASYNPAGIAKHTDGSGFRYWERWDLPADEVADKMKDYALVHTTGDLGDSTKGRISKTLDGVLKSGGEFTSTTGRIRKGVSLGSTGGASSSDDIRSGGASYFFTRIRKAESNTNGFYFKVGRLSRQDAVSYSQDKFGRISAIGSRGKTISDYKQYERRPSNETIFKEGLSIDDLDFIRVRDPGEKSEVLKAFRDNGVETLADGRLIDDIVVVKGKMPKQRVLK